MNTSRKWYSELSLGAQTAYAELFEQAMSLEMQHHLAGLPGSFHQKHIKGHPYWYFAYRGLDGKMRHVYVGPANDDRVERLISRFRDEKPVSLAPRAKSAIALGCAPILAKHFRIVERLGDYGFFRAGGLLIGTHAFIVMGNMLGVRWGESSRTQDIDFAHAGRNVSIALPGDIQVDVHGALESLEMGLLPIAQFNGKVGAQYRNVSDPELRLDFVTTVHRSQAGAVIVPNLNVALEPLKFMEYSLEGTTQGALIGPSGAAIVNVPSPARYAVHKLIIYGERPERERPKAVKDLHQAASLISFYLVHQPDDLNAAWDDAMKRGPGWRKRLSEGLAALRRLAPELEVARVIGG